MSMDGAHPASGDTERVPYEDEDEFEPMYGLPEIPPADERVLWQGEPKTWGIARRVFHVGLISLYFGLLYVWSVVSHLGDGAGIGAALQAGSIVVLPYVILMTLLFGLAFSIARTTVYTLTSRRIVIRAGVAISKAVNVPFAQVDSVGVRDCSDGTVDIVISLEPDAKASYMMLWPHVRPRQWRRVAPMLRAVPAGSEAPRLIAQALAAYCRENGLDAETKTAGSGSTKAPIGPTGELAAT